MSQIDFQSQYLPEVTIAVLDITGFVPANPAQPPKPINFAAVIHESVTNHGGEVLQKLGDGCVAMFRAGEALSAIGAVQAIERQLIDSAVRPRAGIAKGAAIVGTLNRVGPRAITGVAFKTAERLHRACRKTKRHLLVCKTTVERLPASMRFERVETSVDELSEEVIAYAEAPRD